MHLKHVRAPAGINFRQAKTFVAHALARAGACAGEN
jgi:hypothetical protein